MLRRWEVSLVADFQHPGGQTWSESPFYPTPHGWRWISWSGAQTDRRLWREPETPSVGLGKQGVHLGRHTLQPSRKQGAPPAGQGEVAGGGSEVGLGYDEPRSFLLTHPPGGRGFPACKE